MSSPDAAVASNSRDDAKIADAQLQQQIEKDAADVSSTIPSDTGDTSAAGGAEGTSLRLENISRYESEESTPNLTPTSPSLVSAIKGSQKFRKKKSMRVSFSRDLIEERDHTPYIENTQTETDFYDNSDGGIHIPRDYLNSPHSSKSKVPMFAGEDAFYSPSTASSRSDHNSARNKLEETVRDNVLRFHDMLRGKGPNAPASFRDRVMLARTTEEMCIVFGINTVGVFNGGELSMSITLP